jgi:hypothetical protein
VFPCTQYSSEPEPPLVVVVIVLPAVVYVPLPMSVVRAVVTWHEHPVEVIVQFAMLGIPPSGAMVRPAWS